ncbi:MAG: hypothetical protein AAGA56_05050 [Myxococcota bacterium]
MFLLEVARALREGGVTFAIAGGYAVALHGAVRGTVDVDVVLELTEENYVAAERALVGLGLSPRLPVTGHEVFRFRREYIENRNLIAWSFCDPSDPTRLVDIIITFEEAMVPVEEVTVQGEPVPVLAKAALIAMKEATGRAQDTADVDALRRLP